MAAYCRGSIKLFFRGDPTLAGYFPLIQGGANENGNIHGAVTGTKLVNGKFQFSRLFNGTSDYIKTSSPITASVDNLTVMMWVFIASVSEKGCFLHNGLDTTAISDGWSIGVGNTNFDELGNNLIGLCDNVAWMNFGYLLGIGWRFVAMKRAGGTWYAYINGKIGGGTFIATPATPTGNTIIGADLPLSTVPRFWGNRIQEVAIFERALSSAEISAYYNWAIRGRGSFYASMLETFVLSVAKIFQGAYDQFNFVSRTSLWAKDQRNFIGRITLFAKDIRNFIGKTTLFAFEILGLAAAAAKIKAVVKDIKIRFRVKQ